VRRIFEYQNHTSSRSFLCIIIQNIFSLIIVASCSGIFSSFNQCLQLLSLAPTFNSCVQNVIKRLQPSKSVGLEGIPNIVIKDCSQNVVPLLSFIFNLSSSYNTFPNLWKQAGIVPVFKEGKRFSVGNYTSITILNNFFSVSEFITYDHFTHFLISKLNSSQHGPDTSKYVYSYIIYLPRCCCPFTLFTMSYGFLFIFILVKLST
jgi:hypothetical protein